MAQQISQRALGLPVLLPSYNARQCPIKTYPIVLESTPEVLIVLYCSVQFIVKAVLVQSIGSAGALDSRSCACQRENSNECVSLTRNA